MSDMEDDFMCDDEEDYDLVFKTESNIACFLLLNVFALSARTKVQNELVLAVS